MAFLITDFKRGDPVRKVANARNLNRIGNILMGLEVIGRGHIERSYGAEGTDWKLVIDPPGPSSDRRLSADSATDGHLGYQVFTGQDSAAFSATTCIPIRFDICTDSTYSGVGYHRLRMYIKTKGVATAATYILGLDSTGAVVKVATTKTC